MSAPATLHDDAVPTLRYKRLIEKLMIGSGVPYTILRGSLFMDDWFALDRGQRVRHVVDHTELRRATDDVGAVLATQVGARRDIVRT